VSPAPFELVLASANPHKSAEIIAILGPLVGERITIRPRPASIGEIDESGETFEENAEQKARVVAEATGAAAIADDSGLEVDALGGAPGVRSARYAGEGATDEANVAKLLDALAGRPDRSARFRAAVVVAFPDGRLLATSGAVDGRIGETPRGAAGFGYDPIFIPTGSTRSFAEFDPGEKHVGSHRAIALRALAPLLLAEIG
jgi:XTP/dITP diphosphohydrolase